MNTDSFAGRTTAVSMPFGGYSARRPMDYHRIGKCIAQSSSLPTIDHPHLDRESGNETSVRLVNTHEVVHPSVRYRTFHQGGGENSNKLGASDDLDYEPATLEDWEAPKACQVDGRVGALPATTKDDAKMEWSNADLGVLKEAELGRHEKILLALFDDDPATAGVWKGVLGEDG